MQIIWAVPYGLAGLYDFLQGQGYLPTFCPQLSKLVPVWCYLVWLAIGVLLFIVLTFEGAYRISHRKTEAPPSPTTSERTFDISLIVNKWWLRTPHGKASWHPDIDEADGISMILDGDAVINTTKPILVESLKLNIGEQSFPSDWKSDTFYTSGSSMISFDLPFSITRGKRSAKMDFIVDGVRGSTEQFAIDIPSGKSGTERVRSSIEFYSTRGLLTSTLGNLESQLRSFGAKTVWASWWVGRIAQGENFLTKPWKKPPLDKLILIDPDGDYVRIHAERIEKRDTEAVRKSINITTSEAQGAGVRVYHFDGPIMDGLVIAFRVKIDDKDIVDNDLSEDAWTKVDATESWLKVDSSIPFDDPENCPNYVVRNVRGDTSETPASTLFRALVRHYIKMLTDKSRVKAL